MRARKSTRKSARSLLPQGATRRTGTAYVTTHRQNTIDRIALEPGGNDGARHSVAGDPFSEDLIGPSAGAWGRRLGDQGRVGYFLTDGGTKSPPPDGIVRPAKLLRVEFGG